MSQPPPDASLFEIDPQLDPSRLAPLFRSNRRLHIPGFLRPGGPEALYQHLSTETKWSLVLNDGPDVREATPEMRRGFEPGHEKTFVRFAYDRAPKGFQFLYETRRVPDDPAKRPPQQSLLYAFVAFLNSPNVIEFARRLTGKTDIAWADAQATRYTAGHFLSRHDDETDLATRRAAYVYNLTPGWQVDWGGQLQFIADDGHIAEAYVPRFNALNIFAVPQMHAVSIVAPFAPAARYSITGWLRAR